MTPPRRSALDLRLIVITDRRLAAPRSVQDVVAECLRAGAPAIQLRDKDADARELFQQATALRALTAEHGALLFLNDRADVALAAGADGVHLGPDDVPTAALRRALPPGFLIGCSTDDPGRARALERDGADYIGCGAVFGTTTKPEAAGEAIGPARLDEVARAVTIPVVGIGGIAASNVRRLATTSAAGVAVIGAVMGAPEPAAAVKAILGAWGRG